MAAKRKVKTKARARLNTAGRVVRAIDTCEVFVVDDKDTGDGHRCGQSMTHRGKIGRPPVGRPVFPLCDTHAKDWPNPVHAATF